MSLDENCLQSVEPVRPMDDDQRAVFGVEMTSRLTPRRARPDDDEAAVAATDEEVIPNADDRIIPELLREQPGY